MDETDDNMGADDVNLSDSSTSVKLKPKKRSLVERELETSLTAHITSPATSLDTGSTSRYGRARRLKTDPEIADAEKLKRTKSPVFERTPVKVQSPVYKMHASNTPIKTEPVETPRKVIDTDSSLENQIENIYHENISLSRFGSDEKKHNSPGTAIQKVYIRKDMIQKREKDDNVVLIKNMFSPVQSPYKSTNSHLNNILERSSEKYHLNTVSNPNGYLNTASVVKMLDFDSNKKKKKENRDSKGTLSKSDLFDVEAKCEYQVGDLAWARMGTYPFWPCIVTREPSSGMFVKKKLFGRIERDVIHVTFFGDNGRRGWIVDSMLRKFLGIFEFKETREQFSPMMKKKDPRLYAAFFISEKKMPQWTISVEEAETLLREPKRLRIDILNDMLSNYKTSKNVPKSQKSGKITRTASDVSLSESLYDTLFSEDDGKTEDPEKAKGTRKSLDVSEVVTACLDNMAAKTGITKIQRQSHMDRWLQKAKSKTPEKLQTEVTAQKKDKEVKVISSKKKKLSPTVPIQKPYSFRRSVYESQNLKSHHNEHDYSSKSQRTPRKHSPAVAKIEPDIEMCDNERTNDNIDTTGSEALNISNNCSETAETITEILPIVSADDTVEEIQVNICSVEENAEFENCLHSDLNLGNAKAGLEKSKRSKKNESIKVIEDMEVDPKERIETTDLDLDKHIDLKDAKTNKTYKLDERKNQLETEIIAEPSEEKTDIGGEINNISAGVDKTISDNVKSEDTEPIKQVDEKQRIESSKTELTEFQSPLKEPNKPSPIKKVRPLRQTRRTQMNSGLLEPSVQADLDNVLQKELGTPKTDSCVNSSVVLENKQDGVDEPQLNKVFSRRHTRSTPIAVDNLSNAKQTESETQIVSSKPQLEKCQEKFEKPMTDSQVENNTETTKPDLKILTVMNTTDSDKHVEHFETLMDQNIQKSPVKQKSPMKLRLNRRSKNTQVTAEVVVNENQIESKKPDESLNMSGSPRLLETNQLIDCKVDSDNSIASQNASDKIDNSKANLKSPYSHKSPKPTSTKKLRLKRQQSTPKCSTKDNDIEMETPNELKFLQETSIEESPHMHDQLDNNKIIEADKILKDVSPVLNNENTTATSPKAKTPLRKLRLKRRPKTPPNAAEVEINDDISGSQNNSLIKTSSKETMQVEIGPSEHIMQTPAKEAESVYVGKQGSVDEPTNEELSATNKNVDNSLEMPTSNTRSRLKRHTKSPRDLWAEVEAKNNKKPLQPVLKESPKENKQLKSEKPIKIKLVPKETVEIKKEVPKIQAGLPHDKLVTTTEVALEDHNTPDVTEKPTVKQRFKKPTKGDPTEYYNEQMKSLQMALDESQKELCILLEPESVENMSELEELRDIDQIPSEKITSRKVDLDNFIKNTGSIDEEDIPAKVENPMPIKKPRLTRQSKRPRNVSEARKKNKKSQELKKNQDLTQSIEFETEISDFVESEKVIDNTVQQGIDETVQTDKKPVEPSQNGIITHSEISLGDQSINEPVFSKALRSKRNSKSPKAVTKINELKGEQTVAKKQKKKKSLASEKDKTKNERTRTRSRVKETQDCEKKEEKQVDDEEDENLKSNLGMEINELTNLEQKEVHSTHDLLETAQLNTIETQDMIVPDLQAEVIQDTSETLLTDNMIGPQEEDIEYGHLEFTDKHSPLKPAVEYSTESLEANKMKNTPMQSKDTLSDIITEENEYDHLDFIFSSLTKENTFTNNNRPADVSLEETKNTESHVNSEPVPNSDCKEYQTEVLPNSATLTSINEEKLNVPCEEIQDTIAILEASEVAPGILSEKTNIADIKLNVGNCVVENEMSVDEELLSQDFNELKNLRDSDILQTHVTDEDTNINVNKLVCNEGVKDSECSVNLVGKNNEVIKNALQENHSETGAASKFVDCLDDSKTISKISYLENETDQSKINVNDHKSKLQDAQSNVSEPAGVETILKDVNTDRIPVEDDTRLRVSTANEDSLTYDESTSFVQTNSLDVNNEFSLDVEHKLRDCKTSNEISTVDQLQHVTTGDERSAVVEDMPQDVITGTIETTTTIEKIPANIPTIVQGTMTNELIPDMVEPRLERTYNDEIDANIKTNSQDDKAIDSHDKHCDVNEKGTDIDEFVKSVNRLPEPIKVNGFLVDECLDFSDGEFSAETSSINSEDSTEPLAVTKRKLSLKGHSKAKKALANSEFVKYLELRQDELMDEHPELSQCEIVEYLYKTWQYEENAKSDLVKTDDIEQAVLVKGLNEDLRQKTIKNNFRESKKRKKRNEDREQDEDSASVKSFNSDISDTSVKKRLRTRIAKSPTLSLESKDDDLKKEVKIELMDNVSINSNVSYNSTKYTSSFDNELSVTSSLDDKMTSCSNDVKLSSPVEGPQSKEPAKSVENEKKKSPKTKDGLIKSYFKVVIQDESVVKEEQNEIDEIKIKEEYDPDTASINSEDSEITTSKKKSRKYGEKTKKSTNDPEFLKYVEMRQDDLLDENPQLTQEDIVNYLYKTWLYEESVKSDIKKTDELEQANLVKGLTPSNQETPPAKKVKRKVKSEKEFTHDEEVILKDKPKRKVSQPYYNEELTDIEDEIELFEIFKPKKKLNLLSDVKTEQDGEEQEVIEIDEVNEVELYFTQLTQPKPNVFKGMVREKVCDICEKTGNLVKCKGCNSMFHVDCVKKQTEIVEVPAIPTRGRKKKKKRPGRKPKSLEDSESHSDEKSQDLSEEFNASIEDEIVPRTVNADDFEAVLASKMQELLPTVDLTYDSYSSDEGLDWNTAPGKCEIVDVKLKEKTVVDLSNFKCNNCQVHSTPVCFVCKKAVSKSDVEHRQKCQTAHCNKYYHLECLDHWPQTQFQSGEPSKSNKKINEHFEALMCPRHVCHTCVSDDPRGCRTRFSGDKLARCVRCPATYHTFTKCLPAGTQILTGSLIVCPRHYEHRPGKVPCHVNTGWCFICALGGSLICCEYCPTSFHAECLNIDPPEGGYMCEDCETGRLPLYGEMVWVKLGHYRWWPGIVLHPSEIPENIMAVKHSPGEFVVRFFGQYDHYWVNRGRVFPFQEGDSGKISSQKSKIDAAFTTAMEHAQRACEILKTAGPNEEESIDIASSLLPPHYVKLKVNKPCGSLCGRRVDIEESSLTQCECDPTDDDPCGPYSHCLNRMLLTECGPTCLSGERCSNRAFERRLYPQLQPYRAPHRGWGLRTLQDIKAGQFVIEYVGELIDEEEFRRRMNRKHEIRDENFYFLTLDKERMIDAGPKGNLARFMNHCCEPNCETQKWTVLGDVRVGLFALYDIPANSELTFNYNLECAGIEKKRCMCGAKRCSGYIGAKPKQEEAQPKKSKFPAKRTYKKRKNVEESPSTSKNKPKRPVGRPAKPRELTEIEKDLLIIKNATNGISSDSEGSGRLSSVDSERNPKALKRKRVSFSTEENGSKKVKLDVSGDVGD